MHIVVTGQPTMSYVLSRESFFLFGQSSVTNCLAEISIEKEL